ncbi:MAG TPA: HAD hydrolase family protein [Gemmatimonadales bacterium]|nr:HAD hydrolase family protein [Gemmatimonadales bacterium]
MIEPAVARRVKLVGFDVDGTMTDGGLYIGTAGGQPVELKRFDIQDGLGVHLLRAAGLVVAIVTGRAGDAARLRAEELEVDEFCADAGARKLPAFEAILARRQTRWEEACFIGDDLPDLPLLRRVGLPVAVANACREAKEAARYTTAAGGGRGAIREFTEAFLQARGAWTDSVRTYLRERGDVAAR